MRMISVHDEKEQRAILRGEKGVRRQRPTPERFLDAPALQFKFKAVTHDYSEMGGMWLGREYMVKRGRKLFTVKDVVVASNSSNDTGLKSRSSLTRIQKMRRIC